MESGASDCSHLEGGLSSRPSERNTAPGDLSTPIPRQPHHFDASAAQAMQPSSLQGTQRPV